MNTVLINTFSYTREGVKYLVEAEVLYSLPVTDNKHTASCPDDLVYTFEITDCIVTTLQGENVSDNIRVPDEVILRQLEVQAEFDDYDRGYDEFEGDDYEL